MIIQTGAIIEKISVIFSSIISYAMKRGEIVDYNIHQVLEWPIVDNYLGTITLAAFVLIV